MATRSSKSDELKDQPVFIKEKHGILAWAPDNCFDSDMTSGNVLTRNENLIGHGKLNLMIKTK